MGCELVRQSYSFEQFFSASQTDFSAVQHEGYSEAAEAFGVAKLSPVVRTTQVFGLWKKLEFLLLDADGCP